FIVRHSGSRSSNISKYFLSTSNGRGWVVIALQYCAAMHELIEPQHLSSAKRSQAMRLPAVGAGKLCVRGGHGSDAVRRTARKCEPSRAHFFISRAGTPLRALVGEATIFRRAPLEARGRATGASLRASRHSSGDDNLESARRTHGAIRWPARRADFGPQL